MLRASVMRSVKLSLVALAASAALVAPVVAQAKAPGFEGRISLRLQDVEPQGAVYSIRGNHVSIEVPSVAHAHDLRIVFDSARLTSAPGGGPDIAVEHTGHLRLVVGQRCEDWVLRGMGETVRACVVPGISWVDPRRAIGGNVPAWSQRLEKDQAFPISVTEGTDFSWATDVVRGRVPDSAFAAPAATRVR